MNAAAKKKGTGKAQIKLPVGLPCAKETHIIIGKKSAAATRKRTKVITTKTRHFLYSLYLGAQISQIKLKDPEISCF